MAHVQLARFKAQSIRCRATALSAAQDGRWERVEELLWGSVMAAVKAVALARDVRLGDGEEVRRYASSVALETGDRSLGEVLSHVSRISSVYLQVQDSSISRDHLYQLVRRICLAVERLLRLLPAEEEEQDGPSPA